MLDEHEEDRVMLDAARSYLAGRRRRDYQFISWCKRVEGALGVQAFITEMHGMQGVSAQIEKSATDAEKLKATDQIAGAMLATAKLGLAAMQQAKQAMHWGCPRGPESTYCFSRGYFCPFGPTAERCYRLARGITDRQAIEALLRLAGECEARAEELRESPP